MDMDTRIAAITAACDRHGANVVAAAALRRMKGDRAALPEIGLPDAITLGEAYRITEVAYFLMTAEERASSEAERATRAAQRP
jgi:hypothetical protein